ncbi:MAG: FAD-dependent oxidoreductase, partial [Ferrovibrio sp.]
MTRPDVDVAILGGGIAGLWLLARLKRAGYSALLIEREALGAGQT